MIINSDILEWAASYSGPKFHAMICDPPYHLVSGNVSVDWSSFQTEKGTTNKTGRGHKTKGGFMGKQWDGGSIAFQSSTWAAIGQHLHPGAFCMAFASARGFHRMAVAIEDAGFTIHPAIFGWCYGSGFPKASRIAKSEFTDTDIPNPNARPIDGAGGGYSGPTSHEKYLPAPSTPLARTWAGHRYGLQCLKPALEPIIVFQKPYKGKPVDSITATGAGGLNIDAARIGTDWNTDPTRRGWQGGNATKSNSIFGTAGNERTSFANKSGRWPANFFTDAAGAAALDRMSGELKTGSFQGDSGGASRFFFRIAEKLDEADPVFMCLICQRTKEDLECQNVNNAATPLKQKDDDSVQTVVQQPLPQNSVGKSESSVTSAHTAEKQDKITPATKENTVITNARDLQLEKLRQLVKSAASLCDLCATDFALSIVQLFRGQDPELNLTVEYIGGHKRQILQDSLALSAARLGSIDITRIMLDPKILYGFVIGAIENYMANGGLESTPSIWYEAIEKKINDADPVGYTAKAARAERDKGLSGKPEALSLMDNRNRGGEEAENYHFKTGSGNERNSRMRNIHPTVKPISLCKWLATLLLPPAEYAPRRILIPFAGAGSEMVGARKAGWEEIVGIEKEKEYCEIAEARMACWQKLGEQMELE